MGKPPYLYLVIIWSLICVSGLGIFLFEALGPSVSVAPDSSGGPGILVAIGFWLFLWAAPLAAGTIIHRRREG